MNRFPSLVVVTVAIWASDPIPSVAFLGKDDRIQASVWTYERTGPDRLPRRCNDADIRAVAVTFPKLQDLRLGWPGMTDSALREVAKLATLESLNVDNPSETVADKTLEAHIRSIFTKLELTEQPDANRRVAAVVHWLAIT